ncbi:MAG: prenyltransferase [Actinobacteria bacterium]|nr:prenyltransferase [Actinomycetota bacterium]
MLSPVCAGAALAAHRRAWTQLCDGLSGRCRLVQEGDFHWTWLAVILVGAAALHLAANLINDYFDSRTGADKLARVDRSAIPTASGLIESGQMSARVMLGIAMFFAAIAAVAGIWLAVVVRSWTVIWLGAIGTFLAVEYVGPPLRLAYRTRGVGDVAIFFAYGFLPVVGTFYVLRQPADIGMPSVGAAMWAGVVPGLLTTLVVFHQHFLHWRADKAAGKVTAVVALGPDVALGVSGVVIVAAYVVLAVQVALRLFPPLALLGLVTALPFAGAWVRALRDPAPQHYLQLLGATLGASVLTGAALVLALGVG